MCPKCNKVLEDLGETTAGVRLWGCPKCGAVYWRPHTEQEARGS